MIKCSACKEDYKTYCVILTSSIESVAMEHVIRDIYYDEERSEGLCEKCRENLWNDKVHIWKLWLNARVSIMGVRDGLKGGDKIKWTKALKRIDILEENLEKTKEVKKVMEENKKSMEAYSEHEYEYF